MTPITTLRNLLFALAGLGLAPFACGGAQTFTSPEITCEGCDASFLAPGAELELGVSWSGLSRSGNIDPVTEETCEPFTVRIDCEGAPCETTRNAAEGFVSLEESAAREPEEGSCLLGPGRFRVRPVGGGELRVRVELRSVESGETFARTFGPFDASPASATPRVHCEDCDAARVALGHAFELDVRWDGERGGADPILRQPFYLDLDCGGAPCEMKVSGSESYGPLERVLVGREDELGARVLVRASEAGETRLVARLEHAETGELATFELGAVRHLEVDSIDVVCLGGALCGGAEEASPSLVFGVVGRAAGETVLLEPESLRYRSSGDAAWKNTSCVPGAFEDEGGAPLDACWGRLHAGAWGSAFTVEASWRGLRAELSAPAP